MNQKLENEWMNKKAENSDHQFVHLFVCLLISACVWLWLFFRCCCFDDSIPFHETGGHCNSLFFCLFWFFFILFRFTIILDSKVDSHSLSLSSSFSFFSSLIIKWSTTTIIIIDNMKTERKKNYNPSKKKRSCFVNIFLLLLLLYMNARWKR